MRETKFRAWDTKDKAIRDVVGMSFYHDSVSVDIEYGRYLQDDANRFELMQYTGLKDKNGTEIYEGDVLYVEQIDSIDPYIPHKKNVAVIYEGRDTAFVFDEEVGFVIGLYTTPSELEVIGNIYENPELLERDSDERN